MNTINRWLIIALIAFGAHVGLVQGAEPDDSVALTGLTATKTLFDVSVSTPEKLEWYLRVIRRTYDDLLRQGRTPEVIIAFRGPSVRLITSENWSFGEEDQQLLAKAAVLLADLAKLGVRLEACSVATGLFKVDPGTILPTITLVGNTFVSLTGYQNRGYALIPIN